MFTKYILGYDRANAVWNQDYAGRNPNTLVRLELGNNFEVEFLSKERL